MSKQSYWWKNRPWRIVQTNMRETDMSDIRADRYVAELKNFDANTVIINTGGIVASYDTRFPFHFKNPYLTGDRLETIISACQQEGIRVASRVDFSKVRRPVYEEHPEWAYVSPKGSIIDYHGDIHVCFNSEYQQALALQIMQEIIVDLNPDAIFMNMGGYAVGYDYTSGWQGICQCSNCRRLFYEMFGETLPVEENQHDSVYQKYLVFQQKTLNQYYENIHKMISEEKPELLFFHSDMLRHEAGTWIQNSKQNYLYKASELFKVEKYSFPEKEASVTSVDFIDMIYRFSAVSPYQQELRIAQTLAHGGHADYYMVGRLDTHRDKSGYAALQKMFRYHKAHEEDYHTTTSLAETVLVKPSMSIFDAFKANPDEYYGWYYLLSQHHVIFDCIESNELEKVGLDKYKTLILPDIHKISDQQADLLDQFVENGGTLIATGETGQYDERNQKRHAMGLASLGVKQVGYGRNNILSAYFMFDDKTGFPRFEQTDLVYLHDYYAYASYQEGVEKYLKLIPPHRFAPAESAYHTSVTSYPAFTINRQGQGRGVYIPWKPGNEYFNFGFPNMENFMADLLENVLSIQTTGGNLPPMVEVAYSQKVDDSARYVHLINGTGCYASSYFEPVMLRDLVVAVPYAKPAPEQVVSLVSGYACPFEHKDGLLSIRVDQLSLFEALKIIG